MLPNAFSTTLKLIWPRSSLKTTKMSKICIFCKNLQESTNKNAKTKARNCRLPLVHLPFYGILGPRPCFTLGRKTTKSAKELVWVRPNSIHRFSNQLHSGEGTGLSFFGNHCSWWLEWLTDLGVSDKYVIYHSLSLGVCLICHTNCNIEELQHLHRLAVEHYFTIAVSRNCVEELCIVLHAD